VVIRPSSDGIVPTSWFVCKDLRASERQPRRQSVRE